MDYIGIDLGGTKVSAAYIRADGRIVDSRQELVNGRRGGGVAQLILSLCRSLADRWNLSAASLSIGICVPGIVREATGRIWAPNIPGWENYPLRDELEAAFPEAIVSLASDRDCYIMGETWLGAARGCTDAIFLAVGTGIGAGILVDGRLLHGHAGITGAIGWMALEPPYRSRFDACGCLETYASGRGLAACAGKRNAQEVFEACDRGEPLAMAAVDRAICFLGMASANLVSLFNPECIIYGGGVFGPATALIPRIEEEACRWAQPIAVKQCRFLATALPHRAGLFGAAKLAINRLSHV